MPTAHYKPTDSFHVQFAWRLEDGSYLRAIFNAYILDLYPDADKYLVRLTEWVATREDDSEGNVKPQAEMTQAYIKYLPRLVGRRLGLAYEADTGEALHLRLATLTGEHDFFFRFDRFPTLAAEAAIDGSG